MGLIFGKASWLVLLLWHLLHLSLICPAYNGGRRSTRLRSPGIRLSFRLDCFREEICESKADYAVTQEFCSHQVNHDHIIRSWRELSIRLRACFLPCTMMIYVPPLRRLQAGFSTCESRIKTPPRRGMETVCLSNKMDTRCTIL